MNRKIKIIPACAAALVILSAIKVGADTEGLINPEMFMTPVPTMTPTLTFTPIPTMIPVSTATQIPTTTPVPTVTQIPTTTQVPTVTPAPIADPVQTPAQVVDLVLFTGQSNMSGGGGNAKSAPVVASGTGYEFRYGACPAGLYPVTEPFGMYSSGALTDPPGVRGGSLVSAFMNSYYKSCKVPVMGFSASRGGTSIGYWQSFDIQNELASKYDRIRSWCAANGVTIRRSYAVWLQGETDAIGHMDRTTYETGLRNVFSRLFAKGLERVYVIPIGRYAGLPGSYDEVRAAQLDLCATDPRFVLGSDALATLPDSYLADGCHYNQAALNTVGAQAGALAGQMSR